MINTSKHRLFMYPFIKIVTALFIYFFTALLSIKFTNQGTIATWWISNALLLCFILRDRHSLTVYYLLAGCVGSLFANYFSGSTLFISTGFALSNAIEVATVVFLYRWYEQDVYLNETPKNYFIFTSSIIVSCILSAIACGITLYFANKDQYLQTALLWLSVDLLAMLALLPLGLSLSKKNVIELLQIERVSLLVASLVFVFTASLISIHYLPSPFIVISLSVIFSAFFLNFFELSLLCLLTIVFLNLQSGKIILPTSFHSDVNLIYCNLLISFSVIPALLINIFFKQRIKIPHISEWEKSALENKLKYQAAHDTLTGIINRFEFEKKLQTIIYQELPDDTMHSLCHLDIDRFKIVNDSAGYGAGDSLLIRIVQLLKQHLSHKDIFARIGGDEFAIILLNTTTFEATKIAENLIAALRDFRFVWNDKVYQIGLSIGLVSFKPLVSTIEDVMSKADIACYTAKFRGGNNVAVYTAIDSEAAKHHAEIQIVSGMREALETSRLCLYAHAIQPIVPSNQLKPFYELLVRLIDKHGKLINPAQFIPSAERFNLMADIDEWVIKKVLLECGSKIADIPDFTFSINLSANSINAPYFLEFLQNTLEKTPIPKTQIGFELTETAIINYLEKAAVFIQALQNQGCFIALDDFGSGLSSFNYLKHFPVKYVKIDGSFIRMIAESSVDRAIVESINDLAHKLNAFTIAEYVETNEILSILKNIKVDYAQGHAIDKALPLSDLLQQITNNSLS